jgi:CRISPR/Cas system CSM-associated protein Csm3 (group 7 of RAMP superfamily)
MSRFNEKFYYYADITIEALSPLVLASGKTGIFFDVELVRDANGLPAIPGTTIAGILRHAIQKEKGNDFVNKLFGYQNKTDGKSSRLEVSWAYVHDSKNCIHKSYYSKEAINQDPILKEICIKDKHEFKRDQVRLSQKGTAVGTGKYDRYFVPRGARFSFSIGMWCENENNDWNDILKLFFSSSFRIGAAGRSGYGKIKVIEIKTPAKKFFDISNSEDIKNFKQCSESLTLSDFADDMEKEELKLFFPLGFRIGGGTYSFLKNKHTSDMLPYSERVIKWAGSIGTFESVPIITIPGSALKGALRHRAAFHLARINKNWASNKNEENDGLVNLFGYAANRKKTDVDGQAGKLWFTDIYLENTKANQLSRNSIDRFTGGTLPGALFQEENVQVCQTFETYIYLDKSIDKSSDEYKAFTWALDDLKAGRLALGGGSGHGLGFNHPEENN